MAPEALTAQRYVFGARLVCVAWQAHTVPSKIRRLQTRKKVFGCLAVVI